MELGSTKYKNKNCALTTMRSKESVIASALLKNLDMVAEVTGCNNDLLGSFSGEKLNQIKEVVNLLQNGEIVAIPTETVYGLAADAANDEALRKIFAAKGRSSEY